MLPSTVSPGSNTKKYCWLKYKYKSIQIQLMARNPCDTLHMVPTNCVSCVSSILCFLPILCFCQNGFVKLCHSGFRCDRWYFLRPNYEKSCSESPCASISGLVTLNFLVKSFIQVIFVKKKLFFGHKTISWEI